MALWCRWEVGVTFHCQRHIYWRFAAAQRRSDLHEQLKQMGTYFKMLKYKTESGFTQLIWCNPRSLKPQIDLKRRYMHPRCAVAVTHPLQKGFSNQFWISCLAGTWITIDELYGVVLCLFMVDFFSSF